MRRINEIFIHCLATQPGWMEPEYAVGAKIAEVDKWHKARGWDGIGYHYVVDRDGSVGEGRPEATVGAHVAGRNTNSIGVALVGGHGSNETDSPTEHYTGVQLEALLTLVRELKTKYPNAVVRGHNEVAAKACPGFNVKAWWAKQGTKDRTNISESKTNQAANVGAAGTAVAVGGIGYEALTSPEVVTVVAKNIDPAVLGIIVVGLVLVVGGFLAVKYFRKKDWDAGWR